MDLCEKSYAVDKRFCNFYAGGDVSWSSDGLQLFSQNGSRISIVDIITGQVEHNYSVSAGHTHGQEKKHSTNEDDDNDDAIYTFAIDPKGVYFATAHRSGLLRLWSLETHKVEKMWKAQHKGPVMKLAFSPCGQHICSSGSADGTLRLWEYSINRCVCAFKDFAAPSFHIEFHPYPTKNEIFAIGSDNAIYCWNYEHKALKTKFAGHLSQVTALNFFDETESCQFLASVGRDKVLIIWDLLKGAQFKIIPMYEELLGVCFLSNIDNDKMSEKNALDVFTMSAEGKMKLVDCLTTKITSLSETSTFEVKAFLPFKQHQRFAVVTTEHNILIYEKFSEKKSLSCIKQLVGNNDEILDLCLFGQKDRFLAMATNSKDIRLYDTENDMNCKICAGHKETVMTLSAVGGRDFLLSAGKDNSIMLWQLNVDKFDLQCIGENPSAHTSTIGSISFAYNLQTVFATVAQDGSLKVWNLKKGKSKSTDTDADTDTNTSGHYKMLVRYAAVAHEKDVNCVTFAPNNKMLATASADKTVKIWNADSPETLGVLRGHSRGVWCVRFSPVDQVVLSTSNDTTMRLWSLATMSCLKRFEQDCSVLRAEFIDHGKYILSAASDGLIKIWSIKTNECVQTLDEHDDRVWSLAVSERTLKNFYSGAADSKLIRWHDVTQECRNEELDKRHDNLEQEQLLQNLLQQRNKAHKAFVLALNLGKPKTIYKIVCEFLQRREEAEINTIISKLNTDQRNALLEHVKAWSTNSRHSMVANIVLKCILSDTLSSSSPNKLLNAHTVEALTPYVQRHFKRVTEMSKDLAFLEFLVENM